MLGIQLKLEAMLPTIILFVMSVSLPEQDITRKGRVYENATRCTEYIRKT